MATKHGLDRYSIIGIGTEDGEHISLLASGSGNPDFVFEALVGASLRGEFAYCSELATTWMNDNLERGTPLKFTGLQTNIVPTDLNFFLTYWYKQFSTLVDYPNTQKKPSATSGAGHSAEKRLYK